MTDRAGDDQLTFVFFIIQLMNASVMHATKPIFALFANSQGASPFVIGLLASIYSLLPMLLAIRAGKWLDRIGPRRMIFIGLLGIIGTMMIPFIYPHLVSLFISQTFYGIFNLFTVVSLQKSVGNLPGNRDKWIANFSFYGAAGTLVGPMLAGFIYDLYDFRVTLFMFLMFFFVSFVAYWFAPFHLVKNAKHRKEPGKKESGSSFGLLKNSSLRTALIVSGLTVYSKDLFLTYFPVYADDLGMSASMIGVVIAASAAMGMIIRIFQFRLVEMFGRGFLFMAAMLVSGLVFMLIPFSAFTSVLIILSVFLGAGLGLGQPLALVYALNQSPQNRQGEVLGLRITFNRASLFVAPLLFGGLGSIGGVGMIFWLNGAVLLLQSYVTRTAPKKKTPADHEGEQT